MKTDTSSPIEALTPEDQSAHTMLLDELSQAQKKFEESRIELIKAHGAVEAWSRLLAKRYGLEQGDRVEVDGRFIRKADQ